MISDVNFRQTKALPAAGATANSSSLDLGAVIPGPIGDGLRMRISVPATPSLTEAKDITFAFQDSADDSSFADVETTGNMVVTGGASGGEAKQFDFFLPPNVRRYIRATASVESGGGSNIAVSFALEGLL